MIKQDIRKIAGVAIAAAIWVAASSNVNAGLVFTTPLDYNTPDVVGTRDGLNGAVNPPNISIFAQDILTVFDDYGSSAVKPAPSDNTKTVKTSNLVGPFGSLTINGGGAAGTFAKNDTGGTSIPAGWEYAIAKYDGQNAGFVLYYLHGESATIPKYPYDFWEGNETQYAISQWVAFNAVPEPTTIIAGALLLLPFVASTMRIFRKNRTA